MKIDQELRERLLRAVTSSEIALAMMAPETALGSQGRRMKYVQKFRCIRTANEVVRLAVLAGDTDTIRLRMGQRSELEEVLRSGRSREQSCDKVRSVMPASWGEGVTEYLGTMRDFDAVLRDVLAAHDSRQAGEAREPAERMQDGIRQAAEALRRQFRDQVKGVADAPAEPTQSTDFRMTPDRLFGLMMRVECLALSGESIDWHVSDVQGPRGFLVWPSWRSVDAVTKESCRCVGAKFFVSAHAADNEVVQALLRSAIAAAEHEVREAFRFDGVALYRPHQPLEELRDFTDSHAPETREEAAK